MKKLTLLAVVCACALAACSQQADDSTQAEAAASSTAVNEVEAAEAVLDAEAQDERKPLTDVWLMVPKADMYDEFEAALADYMKWRAGEGDSRVWSVFTPAIGHNLGVYQFRACCFEWADQDPYNAEALERGYGEKWAETVDQYVDHYHRYMEFVDWQHSHWPDDDSTDGPYFGVTTWSWKIGAGTGSDSNDALKKMSSMALENGWGEAGNNWLWLRRIGGKPMLMVVSPYSNYADMAPPEKSFFDFISEQMGSEEEADALFDTFGSGFADQDYTVWRYREDLSMQSADGD